MVGLAIGYPASVLGLVPASEFTAFIPRLILTFVSGWYLTYLQSDPISKDESSTPQPAHSEYPLSSFGFGTLYNRRDRATISAHLLHFPPRIR